jgi:hypothetical protein
MRPFAIIIIFLLCSCEFAPDGEFVVQVPEGDLSDVVVNLNLDDDTLYIYNATPFNFTISIGSHQLVGGHIYVGDYEISSGYVGSPMIFTFYPNNVGTGTHKLMVEYFLSSNSGSLADVTGNEKLTLIKEVTLIVDIDRPPARVVTLDSLNGTLTLNWNVYDHWKFKEYVISIQKPLGGGFYYTEIERVSITDKNVTSWTDQKYIGGRFKYEVILVAGNDYVSNEGIYIDSKLHTDFHFTGVGANIEVRWDKPTFYNNIKEFALEGPSGVILMDLDKTSFEEPYPYPFGYAHNYSILLKNESYHHTTWQTITVYFGKPTPQTFDLSYIEFIGNDRFLTWPSPGYTGPLELRDANLDLVNNNISENVKTVATSPDHNYIYFFRDGDGEGIYRLNSETLIAEKIVSINELLGPAIIYGNTYPRTVERMSVSDNNRLAAVTNAGSYVIDMETLAVLHSASGYYIYLNSSGEYLTQGLSIYRWINGQYAVHHTFSSAGDMKFTADAPGEILVDHGYDFRRYRLSDMTVLGDYNHSLDWQQTFSYDPVTRKAIYRGKLIDVNTMTEIPFRYQGPGPPLLMNNTVIDKFYMASLDDILKLQP